MKKLITILVLISLFGLFGNKQANAQTSKARYPDSAIVRGDNTFVSFNDTQSKKEPIPKLVVRKIRKIITESINSVGIEDDQPGNNIVFKINYKNGIAIYVVKIYVFAAISYKLIAYDPKNRTITKIPPTIIGTFMENNEEGFVKDARLIDGRLLYFDRLVK
jgi:hypothetical protein